MQNLETKLWLKAMQRNAMVIQKTKGRRENNSRLQGRKGIYPQYPHCKKMNQVENFRPGMRCRGCN